MQSKTLITRLASLIALSSLVACGSSEPAPAAPIAANAEPAGQAETDDGHEMCTSMFVRQRECQELYLPALVDARVRFDVPAGIAARDAEEGRETLLGYAREEYSVDSTDESIAATCTKIITTISEEEISVFAPMAQQCLETSTCEDYVACDIKLTEARFSREE